MVFETNEFETNELKKATSETNTYSISSQILYSICCDGSLIYQ
jgi:hypothetical protein